MACTNVAQTNVSDLRQLGFDICETIVTRIRCAQSLIKAGDEDSLDVAAQLLGVIEGDVAVFHNDVDCLTEVAIEGV